MSGKGKLSIKSKSAKSVAKRESVKNNFEKGMVSVLLGLTIVSMSILVLFLMAQSSFTGFASYIDSQAGSVTQVEINGNMRTDYWGAIYGLAFRLPDYYDVISKNLVNGEMSRRDLFFSCIQKDAIGGNEVYASTTKDINFNNLRAATVSEIDEYTGCDGKMDCASNTFTDNVDVYIGRRKISNVPAAYTLRWDGNNKYFDVGALTDGSNLVFVSHIKDIQSAIDGGESVNYQMLLPVSSNAPDSYYFFSDPNDVCPQGGGTGDSIVAEVSGIVYSEDGPRLTGAEVTIAGASSITDSDGAYKVIFETIPGEYNLFSTKEGYDNYLSTINFSATNHKVEKNIVMNKLTPGIGEVINVNVYGQVKSSTGIALAGAEVYFGNEKSITDSQGYYNIAALVSPGNYSLVSTMPNYDNYNEFIFFTTEGESLEKEIIMNMVNENEFEQGPYPEEPQEGVAEEIVASGEDFWISSKEITKEVRKNTFIEESIGIYNLKKTPMNLRFQLSSNLKDFVSIDKVVATIAPETFSDVKVSIYGTADIGEYEGVLTISGDLEKEVPIKIKIVDKSFSVEVLLMDVELFSPVVQPDKNLKYKLNLQNLLRDQNYQVSLEAKIKGLNGTVYLSKTSEVEIDNALTLIEEFPIPANFSDGDYLFEVTAKYLNLVSIATASIDVSRPVYMYSFFGIPLWLMFSIISFFSFSALNLVMYKRYQDKKKRYKIQIEYSTLPEPGPRTIKMGHIAETKTPAYYDMDRLTVHSIVAGGTGMGKSISAQVVIEECLMKDTAVIVFDPTAQWSGMLRKCTDKKMMGFYQKFGLKPKDARAFKGNVKMIKDYRQKIDIEKCVAPGQIQIFSMNKLTPSEIDIFVANVIKQIFRSDPKESPVLKTLLVFDEVHRLLPKFGGSGKGFLQIERACREFRKWGLGVMLISQVLNDFAGQIKANINTEFQARTLEEGDLERIRSNYGESFLKSLVRAEIGVIMFQNAAYNRGRPYFVNFRPILHSTRRLTDEELEKYNKYNDLVDELEFQVAELEKEKIDTFDLKMELKLIKDKIMSGSFSVVEIYLEGLAPRVTKEWEKLGKKAPALVIELVDDAEMAAEEAKSKEEDVKAKEAEKLDEQKVEADKEAETESEPEEEKK